MKIILSGSSSGIGRALAVRLLGRGHQVWGLARSDQQSLAESYPLTFRSTRVNVADWEALAKLADEVQTAWTKIDAIVTCAGVQGAIGPALSADPLQWSESVRANLDGTFYTLRAFASLMGESGPRGKIVCFSGGGATKPRPNFSAYAVAKTAVVRLVENIHSEMGSRPIDINAVAPGAINTRLTDEVIKLGPAIVGEAEFAAATAQKARGGASLDRALDLVEWLLSSESDGVSGRLISAPWDPWPTEIRRNLAAILEKEIYTLRRITPEDRNLKF